MRAMILAAGLGTRLRPLTNDRPKALVEVAGQTLLEITLARLRGFGIGEVIVNVHHFAAMVEEYLAAHQNFGMRIEISREETLLDTGGGLKKAGWFFRDMSPHDAFLLHNVDVISNIDLGRMVASHRERQALATLAVQKRKTSRYLLFDAAGQLCGRRTREGSAGDAASYKDEIIRRTDDLYPLAFAGIHVISPQLLSRMNEEDAFSIITTYLRLAGEGEKILEFPADAYYWRDLGKPENVAQAEQDIRQGALAQNRVHET